MQSDDIKMLVNQFPEIIGLVQCFVNQLDTCVNDEGVVQAFLYFTQHFKMYATLRWLRCLTAGLRRAPMTERCVSGIL